uniref:SPATA31 domain-containing protein n=1 Tax=Myotis myotis TaxID=51298 RepID=A0A7J7UPX1_MYOMY|nr:hypothetical protein mMyoMyo1_008683 [Myotis myotis]
MGLTLFLNSLLEFYLSFFCSERLYGNLNIISISVLSLFLFFFIFSVGIPSIPAFWKNEHTPKISFGADPEAKLIDPSQLLFLSPDEHDSAQEYIYPKTWEDNIKKNLAQLFWGLPTLHSESLSSAIHASGEYSIFFNSISNSFTDQEAPGLSDLQSPSLAEVQPQPLPQNLPPSRHLHLTQIQTQAHLQSPLPILPSSPITQNKVCEMNVHIPNNESECHTSSETEHLQCNVLLKEQESLWGLTSVAQSTKAYVAITINPVEFPLSSEFRDKFEHHLRKRLIQHHQGQPCMLNGSLSLMRPLSNCSGILESKSSSGLSRISVEKDQSSENPNVGLSQPGSFYERSSEMFEIEENEGKEEGHSQENDPKVHLLSDSKTSSHKHVDIQGIPIEEIQKILKAKLPLTNAISGKKSQIRSLIANIQPPKLPARRAGTPQEINNNGVNSNERADIGQGANREKSELASRPSMSREIVRAERLKALQPKTSGVLTTSKPGISQKIERDTTVTTEKPPSKISDLAPTLSELRKQLIAEMNLNLESRKQSQAQGQPLDMSSDSDILTYKAPLTPDKCVSSVDTEVHQVLHVQSEDSGVSLEKQQEPWLPKQALRSCQDQNSPPAVKKNIVCPPPEPTGPKYEEHGAGDARLRISRPGGRRFLPRDPALEDMLGSKTFHSLTQTAPSDSLVLHQMKRLFQRLCTSTKCKMEETTQEMGRHISSAQSRGPLQNRAPFTGTTQVDRRRPAEVTTCPQEPISSAVQSGKPVQKGAVQAQAKPVQRRHFQRRAPSYDLTNAVSGLHTAILDGQGSTNTRHTRNEDRPPQNAVASNGPQICQKHPQSVPLRGTLPHPSPNCRPQPANGTPAVLTTAGGTAFRDQPPRFRHTMLLYNFQGQTFPTPK